MTERLSDVNARIASAREIAAVVGAMRAIAAARAKDARARLRSVRAYASAIGETIGRALPLAPRPERARFTAGPGARHVIVAIGAEQGFAGGYTERVLDAALLADGRSDRSVDLLLLGDRAGSVASERRLKPSWTAAMAAHLDQIESIADRVADQIWARVAEGAARVSLVHATAESDGAVVQRSLVPFDFAHFPEVRQAPPPLVNLPPADLLNRLAEEYVFAELCEALTLAFAAESEARVRAMTAAREHVSDMLEALTARARQLRQEEITNEIVELASDRARRGGTR